jgi:RIO-like serine/threonine protein kinase
MLISEDNDGKVIGWMETYSSGNRTVTANVSRDVTTVSTLDRKTGKVKTETFFGKPPVPGAFDPTSR